MLLYATTGDMFSDGRRITFSFMNDGTATPGGQSHLFQAMDAKFSRSTWVNTFDDAFAQWESIANVNLVWVSDDGAAEDEGNVQQGSVEFGDIRIGAYSMGPNVAALTYLPPKANGGSNSGDIFLNTDVNWENNGSGVDLETIAMHEIGHALGMGHSSSSSAVMFPNYNGQASGLSSDDIAGVQSIWGPRKEDAIQQATGNQSASAAANINGYIQSSNDQIAINALDVAGMNEDYYFRYTTPANASANMSVTAQSSYLSELSPWVQIYDNSNHLLAQNYGTGTTYGATMTASISNATPNTTYIVRISGYPSKDTTTGNYALLINMGTASQSLAPPPGILVYAQADQGAGSSPETFGGADGPTAKPDLPDPIRDGSKVGQGDIFELPPVASPPAPRINVPHPTAARRGNRPPQGTSPIIGLN